jgi:hypothetical protein
MSIFVVDALVTGTGPKIGDISGFARLSHRQGGTPAWQALVADKWSEAGLRLSE